MTGRTLRALTMAGRPTTRRLAAALLMALPSVAHAQSVRITGLTDMPFGSLPTTGVDQQMNESVCADRLLLNAGYSVTATGSGTGNAFTLSNGTTALPYEVQWSSSAGQTSGTNLNAGVTLTGQNASLVCTLLGSADASLIVLIRGTKIASAKAGSYSGTLTIILSAN
jgi:hypothetical protein